MSDADHEPPRYARIDSVSIERVLEELARIRRERPDITGELTPLTPYVPTEESLRKWDPPGGDNEGCDTPGTT